MTAHKIMIAQIATRQALMMGDSRKHSKLESDKDRYLNEFFLFKLIFFLINFFLFSDSVYISVYL